MSRSDYATDLSAALDRFDAPALSDDFADRTMAVASRALRPTSRDRRSGWKVARRAIIGTVAAGMVSAAAVASGLLGAAGIQVPVLSAMLAPAPEPAPIQKAKSKPVGRPAALPKVVAVPAKPADASLADPGLVDPGSLVDTQAMQARTTFALTRRDARRVERRQFFREHPELVPVIKAAMQREKAFVQANPQIRDLRRMAPVERKAYLAARPELQAAVHAHQAERRAFRAANPQAVALLRAQSAQRRVTMSPLTGDPTADGNFTLPR